MRYFNCETVVHEAGIPADNLQQRVEYFTLEEPHDLMLAELHLLRAWMAIKNGRLTLDTALNEARKLAA
jgi:hypothetical protein